MKTIRIFIFFFLIFFSPAGASAQIIISEIAWMGRDSSANDEWIELANEGEISVDLSSWTLEAMDGSPNITLSGTISSGGIFLLERTDESTLPNLPAGLIYTGALKNEGEILILKNNGGEVFKVDTSSGWPGGNNSTKETMQWNGSSWITGSPTPGIKNTEILSNQNKDADASNEEKVPPTSVQIIQEPKKETIVLENKKEENSSLVVNAKVPVAPKEKEEPVLQNEVGIIEKKENKVPEKKEKIKETAGNISQGSTLSEEKRLLSTQTGEVIDSTIVIEKPRSIFLEMFLLPITFFKFIASFFN